MKSSLIAVGTVITDSASKSAAYHTAVELKDISVPAGTWLIISYMDLNASGSGVYNHGLGTRIVRAPEGNGGGSINSLVVTGPTSVKLDVYHNISGGATARASYDMIRIK